MTSSVQPNSTLHGWDQWDFKSWAQMPPFIVKPYLAAGDRKLWIALSDVHCRHYTLLSMTLNIYFCTHSSGVLYLLLCHTVKEPIASLVFHCMFARGSLLQYGTGETCTQWKYVWGPKWHDSITCIPFFAGAIWHNGCCLQLWERGDHRSGSTFPPTL